VLRITALLLTACLLAIAPACARKQAAQTNYNTAEKSRVIMASEGAGEKKMIATCPANMILIPAGPTVFGPPEETNHPAPPGARGEKIDVAVYCIDRFEWPNQNNAAPVRSVSWIEANNFCTKAGKRLCTETEFEKACRGPVSTRYAYGDGYAASACRKASEDYTVGSSAACVSGFGVYDMSGGVYEWTASPPADNAQQRYLRGGLSAESSEQTGLCTFRIRYNQEASNKDVGFRCCAAVTVSPAKE
jgi:hypothetical protein